MLPQFNILRYDKEAQQLKEQWEEVFPTKPFPSYTYDVEGHKRKIKEAIAKKDSSIATKYDDWDYWGDSLNQK